MTPERGANIYPKVVSIKCPLKHFYSNLGKSSLCLKHLNSLQFGIEVSPFFLASHSLQNQHSFCGQALDYSLKKVSATVGYQVPKLHVN